MEARSISAIKSLQFIHDNAEDYAIKKAHRVYLDQYRRVVRAQQMAAAERRGIKSVAAQEREAYTSDAYELVLRNLETAIIDEEKASWKMEAAKMEVEVWRSMNANHRTMRDNSSVPTEET